MKLVFVDEPVALADYFEEAIPTGIEFVAYQSPPIDERQIIHRAQGADVIVVDPVSVYSSHTLRQLPSVRTIITLSVDTHHIDTAYCKSNDISIINFPGLNARGAAEAAIARASELRRGTNGRGRELHNCTLGVIGAGHVGAAVTELGHALGMNVLCHTRRGTPERARRLGIRSFTSMRNVLRECEVIVAAIGGDRDTKNAITDALLREMQPDAVFVSVGRWNAFDIYTLADMKYRGLLAGVAIDCSAPRPPESLFEDVLIQEFVRTPGVILTPDLHTITDEARRKLASQLRCELEKLSRQGAKLRSTLRGR